ncbi:MAG: hypothetical protein HY899_10180 [Deltaproteobacteria bacterium]|nr:hypothetical protein [Deltaproteobacteria bacterium]
MSLPSLDREWLGADRCADGQRAATVSAGPALSASLLLSVLAITLGDPRVLFALSAANVALAACFRTDLRLVKHAARVLAWQTAVLGALYWLRFGLAEGTWPALRTSWQLFLAFTPGMIVMHGTRRADLERTLARALPHRAAFVLTVCLKFVPMLLAEIRTIYEAQVLRGARILPRDLARPRNWPDVIHCLVVPAVVRGLALAEHISLAARARDFGLHPRRTCWPGS